MYKKYIIRMEDNVRRVRKKSSINIINVKTIILEHINNNLKDYIILILFFIVGIILGVIFINNSNDLQTEQNI